MIHIPSQLIYLLLSVVSGISFELTKEVGRIANTNPWTSNTISSVPYSPAYSAGGLSSIQFGSTKETVTQTYDLKGISYRCARIKMSSDEGHYYTHSNDSCCLRCRREPICRKIGNCCDRTLNNGGFMCHLPYVKQGGGVETLSMNAYFMVDRCLNGSEVDSCTTIDAAAWGSLYPVYDQTTDLNFLNSYCAECNGAYSYIHWNLRLESSNEDWSLFSCLSIVLGYAHDDCTIRFTPPKVMDTLNHVCKHDLINSCNVTGMWSLYDLELDEACQQWFSPLLDTSGTIEYANVFCAMCNGIVPWSCTQLTSGSSGRTTLTALSMVLDFREVNNAIAYQKRTHEQERHIRLNERCGRFMIKHPRKVTNCTLH